MFCTQVVTSGVPEGYVSVQEAQTATLYADLCMP
jgi:hypothetical protein